MANHEMIQYFRGDGNHPIGVMVATYDDKSNSVRIGWSKCNKKDQFVRERGLNIARKRTEAGSELPIPSSREFVKDEITTIRDADNPDSLVEVPVQLVIPRLQDQYETFLQRVVTYFKSVSVDNFFICGPIDGEVSVQDVYGGIIAETRANDIERQKEKVAK